MSDLYLIRHGQAAFGERNYDRLSANGLQQAKILGRHFAGLRRAFDALYSGTLVRQQKTAQTVTRACREAGLKPPAVQTRLAFDEYDAFAVWHAQTARMRAEDPSLSMQLEKIREDRRAFQQAFARVMTRWVSGRHDQEGEPRWAAFKSRVLKGLESLMAAEGGGRRVAVFTSGGPIAVVAQRALALSDQKAMALSWQILNASVTRFKFSGKRIALTGFNDVTHLEMTGDEGLLTYR